MNILPPSESSTAATPRFKRNTHHEVYPQPLLSSHATKNYVYHLVGESLLLGPLGRHNLPEVASRLAADRAAAVLLVARAPDARSAVLVPLQRRNGWQILVWHHQEQRQKGGGTNVSLGAGLYDRCFRRSRGKGHASYYLGVYH